MKKLRARVRQIREEEGTVLSTELFSFDKKTFTFSAEASDLPGRNAPKHLLLQNPSSKKKVDFGSPSVKRDRDNDVQSWDYKSQDGDEHLAKLKVVIFND